MAKTINTKRSHADGYEHAMQFRGTTLVWLIPEVKRVAEAMETEVYNENHDRETMAYRAGLIEGYQTLISEIVKG